MFVPIRKSQLVSSYIFIWPAWWNAAIKFQFFFFTKFIMRKCFALNVKYKAKINSTVSLEFTSN